MRTEHDTARTADGRRAHRGFTVCPTAAQRPAHNPPHVLGVACAFAELRGERHPQDAPRPDHPDALGAFLERVRSAAGAEASVHLLTHGIPADGHGAPGAPDTAGVSARPRWHHAPGPAAWTDETRRLLAADAQLPSEPAPDLPRLRDPLLTWSTTWTASAAPFTRIAVPRPPYDAAPAICGSDNDSNAREARPRSPRGSHGDPADEQRLGLSRRVVRAGLRALAEEGMLDPLPGGATAVPAVTAKDVLDLYALRASLGALLIRRVAMLGRDHLTPVSEALAEVRAAARDGDHVRIREVDLRSQDALARIADLPPTRTPPSSTRCATPTATRRPACGGSRSNAVSVL
ncbi:GntR family transcriptional regulator [Streptomyces rapamycinicus]|uniref:Transposase n=2 Tax=Streptomyces rapamycinicus TaxID=1226757 RepID=A0A3L8R7N5_STRRN|nr:GntR family transcriptional regulator [Streptomyces rapamycinicus]MBB4779542.1 hypothetical protein [Streptomyces rapamycinicus]RLV75795.1 transposase [Streptomyces rapamycinicus NRRL 5491]UTP28308.1 GntR family transcriptional regulator [Streptomyces rapamycinicus NRRL 5491]